MWRMVSLTLLVDVDAVDDCWHADIYKHQFYRVIRMSATAKSQVQFRQRVTELHLCVPARRACNGSSRHEKPATFFVDVEANKSFCSLFRLARSLSNSLRSVFIVRVQCSCSSKDVPPTRHSVDFNIVESSLSPLSLQPYKSLQTYKPTNPTNPTNSPKKPTNLYVVDPSTKSKSTTHKLTTHTPNLQHSQS